MERSETHNFSPIAKSDPMPYRPVVDPDLQIGEGGGGGHPDPEIRWGPVSVWSKHKGGGGGEGAAPLGPPAGSATAVRSVD